MTESYIYYPDQLTGEQLDIFLAKGWYRMHQGIFTTHFLLQEDGFFRVYWMRYDLDQLTISSSSKKIIAANRDFESRIVPFQLTDELETLFQEYKTGIDFNPAESVRQWIFGEQENKEDVFDSHIIEIRDKEKLIAAGIFDKGKKSIAGIMNFYHPDYRKYSPGKFLMLLKIQYALDNNRRWYYPGYIVCNNPKFDYKLFADKKAAELFIPERNRWQPYTSDLMNDLTKASFPGTE